MANRERVLMLIDALESGKFTQGIGSLYQQDDGVDYYCCLGVACVVAKEAGVIEEFPWNLTVGSDGFTNSVLPEKVKKWYGFNDPDPTLAAPGEWVSGHDESGEAEYDGGFLSATDANDSERMTFSDIAGLLRRRYAS